MTKALFPNFRGDASQSPAAVAISISNLVILWGGFFVREIGDGPVPGEFPPGWAGRRADPAERPGWSGGRE